jgi:hypothetical protein
LAGLVFTRPSPPRGRARAGKCVLSFNDQLNAEQHVAEALKALKA